MKKNNLRKKFNIAIITNNDKIWNIPLIYRTCKKLKKNYNVQTLYILPDTISNKASGKSVPLWYLMTFGSVNFCLLSIFSIVRIIWTIKKLRLFSFEKISQKFKIDIVYLKDINSNFLKSELIRKKTDIVLIHTTHILKNNILQIPGIRFINLYCGNSKKIQGVMPYFWSYLKNINKCMTFHLVNNKINHGKILKKIYFNDKNLSMVGFYKKCFEKYPVFIENAIKKSFTESKERHKIQKNYFSYPDKEDYIRFSKKGGKIINIRDIFSY